jgi:GNAT superfamily N-acetyltransferase
MAIEIISGYRPGVIGRTAELHGIYYAREWGFTSIFESRVASGLGEFFSRFDPERDGFWSLVADGRVEGAIAVDGLKAGSEGAHLRWFIISDSCRHKGLGAALIAAALGFCREKGYREIFLWTFKGLDPARRLYEKHGFRLVSECEGEQWGTRVIEQKFLLRA